MDSKLLEARKKIFNSIKRYEENGSGFDKETFAKWKGDSRNKDAVKILAGSGHF